MDDWVTDSLDLSRYLLDDLEADGRFTVIVPSREDSDLARIDIEINWFSELDRLMRGQ